MTPSNDWLSADTPTDAGARASSRGSRKGPLPHLRSSSWLWRVRRLAALKLRHARIGSNPSLNDEIRGRELHANELAQRQMKADLWRDTPICTRRGGRERANKYPLDPDHDRHRMVIDLEYQAGQMTWRMIRLRMERHRYRNQVPPPRDCTSKPEGPFTIVGEELPKLLGMNIDRMLHYLENRMCPPTPPRRPDGKPQSTPPPGRPTPPTPVHRTYEGALKYIIPFGAYYGKPLEALTGDGVGLSYLWWLANEASIKSPTFAEAVEVVYEKNYHECENARERRFDYD